MEISNHVAALSALAHEGRLRVFRLLARRLPDGARPARIAAALNMAPSTLAAHLATLERAGLISSAREGRAVLYRAEPEAAGALIRYLVADCCRGRPEACAPLAGLLAPPRTGREAARPRRTLFLCVGNSARSILAEAILARLAPGRFRAFSAGVRPAGAVHPLALETLRRHGHDVAGLHSKPLEDVAGAGAPRMDFVITLCDAAADEECPFWPGAPVAAHWGMPDPAAATGGEDDRRRAFETAYGALRRRLAAFAALPLERLDRAALQERLDEIGALDAPRNEGGRG